MTANRNHLFADDMWGIEHGQLSDDEKAILTADYTPAERYEGVLYTAPQGRVEQGWPVRRCSPEMAVYDPSDDDSQPREDMSGAEAWMLLLAYVASVLFTCWAFSMVAAYVKELL